MSGSESLDPKEPGDPSPHELGVYSVVCMCAIRTLIIYVSLCIYVRTYGGPKHPHMYEYCFCYIL